MCIYDRIVKIENVYPLFGEIKVYKHVITRFEQGPPHNNNSLTQKKPYIVNQV